MNSSLTCIRFVSKCSETLYNINCIGLYDINRLSFGKLCWMKQNRNKYVMFIQFQIQFLQLIHIN